MNITRLCRGVAKRARAAAPPPRFPRNPDSQQVEAAATLPARAIKPDNHEETIMNQHVNRRSLVANTAAAAVATAAVIAATGDAKSAPVTPLDGRRELRSTKLDAELFRLKAEYFAVDKRVLRAHAKVTKAEKEVCRLSPPKPDTDGFPKDLHEAYGRLTVNQLSDPENATIIALHERREEEQLRRAAWKAECDEIIRKSGLREAEAKEQAAMAGAGDVAARILDTPARTPAGLLVKLSIHDHWAFEDWEILKAITADLEAMTTGAV
jgi:hypothetical protein